LSNTDENIKNILQEKFASHESTVNPEIWNSISNGLSSASSTTAASFSISKIIGIAAAVVVATVTTLIALNSSNQDEKTADSATLDAKTKTEETSAPNKSENSTTQNSPEISSSNQKQIIPNNSVSIIELPSSDVKTEDLIDGNWQDINDNIVGINDGLEYYQNSSDNRNDANNIYNDIDEPVSASFHTNVVDVASIRYFFFPKTSANALLKLKSSAGYSSSDITFSHQFSEKGK